MPKKHDNGDIELSVGFESENVVEGLKEVEAQVKKTATKVSTSLADLMAEPEPIDVKINSEEIAQEATHIQDNLKEVSELITEVSQKGTKRVAQQAIEASEDVAKSSDKMGKALSKLQKMVASILIWQIAQKAIRGFVDYLSRAMLSNEEFKESLETIKGNLLTAFQPLMELVVPAVTKLAEWLAIATTYLAAFIAGLSGKSLKAMQDSAKALNDEAKALDKASGSLAKFDEISQLTQDTTIKASFETDIDTSWVEDLGKKFADEVLPIVESLKKAFEAMKPILKELKPLFETLISLNLEITIQAISVSLMVVAEVLKVIAPLLDELFYILSPTLVVSSKLIEKLKELGWLEPIIQTLTRALFGVFGVISTIKDNWGSLVEAFQRGIDRLQALIEKFKRSWDWVANLFNGKSNKVSDLFPESANFALQNFNIPALASGTVVPKSKPFLAMLGDNTQETEIVSPLSTIKEAVAEVLAEMSTFGFSNSEVILEIDGREFGRAVLEHGDKERNRRKVVLK